MAAEPGRWTEEQWDAITRRGGHLLVSAAAGAGKTAVLVERALRRLADPEQPVDADRLLVVTFTEAAAAEMRERLARALERAAADRPDDPHLARQRLLLPKAAISTFHAFCLSLVRQHFYRLPVDPAFRVLGEVEARLLQAEVLEELFEALYAAGDAAFLDLVDRYGGRGDEALREAVLRLYALAWSLPDPEGWLQDLAARFALPSAASLADTPWLSPFWARCRRELARAERALADALDLARAPGGPVAYAPALEVERAALAAAAAARPRDWAGLRAAVVAADEALSGRLPAARGDVDAELRQAAQRCRQDAREAVRALRRLVERPEAEWLAELRDLAGPAEALVGLVRSFAQAYAEAKLARGAVDFADLEHLALRLLTDGDPAAARPSEVARQLRQRFVEVLVDEYQDVSPVQDALLRLLAPDGGEEGSPNLFLVGDVKQSIYGFRLAEPGLFLRRYHAYARGEGGGRRVHLRHNFRSRRPVVDAVNFLFRQLMTGALGDLAYDADAELVAAADYPPLPPGAAGGDAPVELHLLEGGEPPADDDDDEADPAGDDLTALEREAAHVARLILGWAGRGDAPPLHVWDAQEGGYRPLRFGDVAVLLRAPRGRSQAFADVLARAGVPVHAESGAGYLGALEVRWMVSLLRVIDNPRQDIPLAAVLRSPVVGLDDEQLARIRLACPRGDFHAAARRAAGLDGEAPALPAPVAARLRAFFARLEEWRTAARRGPLSVLVDRVYRETGLLDFVSALPGGAQRRANLLALWERARQFDRFSRQGLFRFLRFLERLEEEGEDLGTPPALGPGEDAVRMLSIHRSKGLEFPVVVVADLGRPFNRTDQRGDVLCHRTLGLGLRVVDLRRRLRYPSLAHRAVAERLRQDALAEELRLLYVALTRARERLVLVGTVPDAPRALARWGRAAQVRGWALPDPWLAGAASFLDWIVPAVLRHADAWPLRAAAGLPDPVDPEVARHASRWRTWLWPAGEGAEPLGPAAGEAAAAGEAEAPRPVAEVPGAATDGAAAGAGPEGVGEPATAPAGPAAEVAEGDSVPPRVAALAARLSWEYPWRPLCYRFAKRAVSELKGRLDPARLEEPLPADLRQLVPRLPRFARLPGQLPSPAERGAATHRLLQHLDLAGPLDAEGVRQQAEALVARELLRPEEARWADCEAIARFFASPLGRRIRARPHGVRREVAFTLALPAAEVYPDLPPGLAEGERVVVQGAIDLLLDEDGRWVLVEFKTDRPGAAGLAPLVERYRGQVDLYRRAVAAIWGRPPGEAYLVFLLPGVAVPL